MKPKMHKITLNIGEDVINEWKQKTMVSAIVGGIGSFADCIVNAIVEGIEKDKKQVSLSLKNKRKR